MSKSINIHKWINAWFITRSIFNRKMHDFYSSIFRTTYASCVTYHTWRILGWESEIGLPPWESYRNHWINNVTMHCQYHIHFSLSYHHLSTFSILLSVLVCLPCISSISQPHHLPYFLQTNTQTSQFNLLLISFKF
jgi:hypothetical protein